MKLNLLYVDTERVWRGGQEQLFWLMRGMRGRGHQVWLACPESAPLAERANAISIPTLHFSQRFEFSPYACWRLLRIMIGRSFDVLHFNTPRAIFCGGLAGRICRVGSIVCSRRVNFPLRSRLSRLKYNVLLDRVLTVSASIRATLIRDGVRENLLELIYEGVDLDWLDRLPAPHAVSGFERSVIRVATVAALTPEKGHETILEAVRLLKPRFPNVRYLFVGEGPLRSTLESQAQEFQVSDQIHFLGFRTDSESLIKHCEIFCLPSHSEGLSSAILAAMAAGLPVIATETGGIPELVEDGVTGILVPPRNPTRLGQALARLFEAETLRREMGQAGRRRVESEFTLSKKLDRTEDLYRRLLQPRKIR